MSELITVVVREWNNQDGWGVLDSETTPGGCWAHYSAVDVDVYHELAAGQTVLFDFEAAKQDGFEFRAVRVSVPGRAPATVVTHAEGSSAYRSELRVGIEFMPNEVFKASLQTLSLAQRLRFHARSLTRTIRWAYRRPNDPLERHRH